MSFYESFDLLKFDHYETADIYIDRDELELTDFFDVSFVENVDEVEEIEETLELGSPVLAESFRTLLQNKTIPFHGRNCYLKHAVGSDTNDTIENFHGGNIENCQSRGIGKFCRFTVRMQRGTVRQIHTDCAQEDFCEHLAKVSSRERDECKVLTDGTTFQASKKYSCGCTILFQFL